MSILSLVVWMKWIYFLLASKTPFRLLQNIHGLLSIWHMPASSLAVLLHNAVRKQTSRCMFELEPRHYSTFKKWYLTSKIKRSASISINVYLHFSRKGEFSFLKKMRIILKMSFRISCCYYMFYICWGTLSPVYFVFPCPCYSSTYLNVYFIDLESLWNYHKPGQADEFKTRTMFIFLTIFLNKCWNSRWTKKYENAALEAHHCNYNS